MLQQQHSALVIEDRHRCRHRETLLSNPSEPISHPRRKMAPDCTEELLEHETRSIARLPESNSHPYQRHGTSNRKERVHDMTFAVEIHWEYVLLAGVVAFIVLCTIISLILKELYRRQ